MKILFFLASIALAVDLYAQSAAPARINYTDLEHREQRYYPKGSQTPFEGEVFELFKNGQLAGTSEVKDGQMNGHRVVYYPDGKTKIDIYYKANKPHGSSREYHPNGQLRQEGVFENGKEIGYWTDYHPNGQKRQYAYFEQGKPHGICTLFYDNGQIEATITMNLGRKEGEYRAYNREGKLTALLWGKNDELDYSDEFNQLFAQAHQLEKAGQREAAIEGYTRALAANPTSAQAYFNRAYCKGLSLTENGIRSSIEDYTLAIEYRPDFLEAYENRGNAKINCFTIHGGKRPSLTEAESACQDFQKAISLETATRKTIAARDKIYMYCGGKEEK